MKTRFAPSPTGPFHIGGLRTALLSQVIAQKMGGESVLRIEDTDTTRSTTEYEHNIIDGLNWCGLDFGTPCFKQSERLDRYKGLINQLLKSGHAYYCYMTQDELDFYRNEIRTFNKTHPDSPKKPEKYDNRYRPENWPNGVSDEIKKKNPHPVIRLKMPTEGYTQWNDLAKGGISIQNIQLDDLIIARSDGSPTYNFVVVVDDLDTNITHVIRGEDHINNTPKQIQIANILKQLPGNQFSKDTIEYCHIPLMFNPDGSKISKSALADPKNQEKVKNGLIVPAAVEDYKQIGILPDALINYLLLISSQKTSEIIKNEIFSKHTFIKHFDFSHLSKTNAQFDFNKLKEINFKHIQSLSPIDFEKHTIEITKFSEQDLQTINFKKLIPHIQQRCKLLTDVKTIIENLFDVQNKISLTSDPFVQKLIACNNEFDFKQTMKEQADLNNQKLGDVAKTLRINLNIQSGLPLFEIFNNLTSPNHQNSTKLKP